MGGAPTTKCRIRKIPHYLHRNLITRSKTADDLAEHKVMVYSLAIMENGKESDAFEELRCYRQPELYNSFTGSVHLASDTGPQEEQVEESVVVQITTRSLPGLVATSLI